jgi:hypothetical protein
VLGLLALLCGTLLSLPDNTEALQLLQTGSIVPLGSPALDLLVRHAGLSRAALLDDLEQNRAGVGLSLLRLLWLLGLLRLLSRGRRQQSRRAEQCRDQRC